MNYSTQQHDRKLKLIFKIAKKVRRQIIKFAKEENRRIRLPTLLSGCSFASYVLYQVLKMKNIDAKLVACDDPCHFWVEVDDYIIDLTATQFEKVPSIFMYKQKDHERKYYHLADYVEEEAINYLKTWIPEENPFNKRFANSVDRMVNTVVENN